MKKVMIIRAAMGFVLGCVLLFVGAYLDSKGKGPLQIAGKVKRLLTFGSHPAYALIFSPKFDSFGRLIFSPGKTEIPCPKPSQKTQVLLLIGQSNAANHLGQRYASEFDQRVVNYFDGKCYRAASPLLGASGIQGESWTLLSNKMIASDLADTVVMVPAAITSTAISEWADKGALNTMLLHVMNQLSDIGYNVTRVIWHQGEMDYFLGTTEEAYKERFYSLLATLRSHGVEAPVYVSIASGREAYIDWSYDNPVSRAQRGLIDHHKRIYLGADTDRLVSFMDRYDGTHFSATGQEKFTDALIDIFRLEGRL